MVKTVEKSGKTYFVCEACDMAYETEELASKCEKFCRENKSCNVEIIKHAVKAD